VDPPGTIHTIGHSTHELEELIGLLKRHGVGLVADVRAFPASRRLPHFNAAALEHSLPEAGVGYVHLPELGGRRKPRRVSSTSLGWQQPGFRAYADHLGTPEFEAGLAKLTATASATPAAVMCAEGLWWRCHRQLIADALLVRGWRVVHIMPDGKTAEHRLTSFAVAEDERLSYPGPQISL
jgi:uncharacterized protein (DUF488 family)